MSPWWWLAIVVGVLWTAASIPVWPFANCRRCEGKGRWPNPNPSNFWEGPDKWIWCSVCRGTGRRVRLWSRR